MSAVATVAILVLVFVLLTSLTGCRSVADPPPPEPGPSAEQPPPEPRLEVCLAIAPVALYEGMDPAFSPSDGTLAFARNSDDGGSLWLATPGMPERSVYQGSESCYLPTWSPDGSRIAFLSSPDDTDSDYVDGRVLVYDVRTGATGETQATACLFTYDRQGPLLVWLPDSAGLVACGCPITFWDAVTGSTREVSLPGAKAQLASVSPDGKTVVYEEYVDGNAVIKTFDVASGDTREVYSWGPLPAIEGQAWAPEWVDAETLLVATEQDDMTWQIRQVDLTGGSSKVLRDQACMPLLAPDRGRFLFIDPETWGGGLYDLASGVASTFPEGIGLPAQWSPDGTRLLSWGLPAASVFYPETGEVLPLFHSEAVTLGWHPAWSADGSLLALEAETDGRHEIAVVQIPSESPAGQ